MIDVWTVIRHRRNGRCVELGDWRGALANLNYVEGAIVIRIGSRQLIGPELWDDVNHLWGFAVDALAEVSRGRDATMWWPDQPIGLLMAPIRDCIQLTIRGQSICVDKAEFIHAMASAAVEFFGFMETHGVDRYTQDKDTALKLMQQNTK